MEHRGRIVDVARTTLGTPFHHQARLPCVGIDCVGVVIYVGRKLELIAEGFDFKGYSRSADGVTLLAECDRHMVRIKRADLQPGDVIALRYVHEPQHLAIVGDYVHGGLSMIHADARIGRVVEHRIYESHERRIKACFRMPGVE